MFGFIELVPLHLRGSLARELPASSSESEDGPAGASPASSSTGQLVFGGSWHDSDEAVGEDSVPSASHSSPGHAIPVSQSLVAEHATEREAWLRKYLSIGDEKHNQRLVQEAATKWPMAADLPVPHCVWEDS